MEGWRTSLMRNSGMIEMLRALRYWPRDCRLRASFWRWTSADELKATLYRQFVAPGNLVFDVGANMGNRAKVFVHLGARVVAVEPQRRCADELARLFLGKRGFALVRSGLGARKGEARVMVGSSHVLSSFSREWIAAVQASGRFGACVWEPGEVVPIQTLDELINEFGVPAFIKIDVEGYEYEVVRGLSKPVPAMSLEFTPEFMTSTLDCIEHLRSLGEPEFQISDGETMRLLLPRWVTSEEVTEILGRTDRTSFGDLYVRFLSD